MILKIVCIFLVVISFGECIPYKSGQIGGDGGGPFDDVTDYSLQNGDYVFRLENILLWGSDQEPIPTFQGSFAILDVHRGGTRWAVKRGSHATGDARHFIILKNREVVERMYGYYGSLPELHNGVYLINNIGFDVRRTDGTLESFNAGIKRGANVSVLGPIVGFYGGAGGAVDFVGCYVDPSWWPDRPSRLVMYPAAGKGHGDGTEYSFDHNVQLGEPFVLRIAKLVIYHSSTYVNGLYVVYENDLREQFTVSDGTTSGGNVTVTFEMGDYIKILEVNDDFGSTTDNCLAGMKLTVFRGESATEETFSIAAENNLDRTEGPVVAFYGLVQGTNLCIARLGGYRLLDSSELSKTCDVPNIPDYGVLDGVPERIGRDHVLTVSCRNSSHVAVNGTVLRCREDGMWDGEPLDCRVACPTPVIPANGAYLDIPEFLIDNVTIEVVCDYGFQLTKGGVMTCIDGEWEGDEPRCTLTCRNPISPINGSFTGLKKWYLPNDTLPLTCDGDFVPNGNSVFTCQSSGSWSGGQPICAPPSPTSVQPSVPATTNSPSPTPTNCPAPNKQITLDSSTEEVWSRCGGVLMAYIVLIALLLLILVIAVGFSIAMCIILFRKGHPNSKERVFKEPFVKDEIDDDDDGRDVESTSFEGRM